MLREDTEWVTIQNTGENNWIVVPPTAETITMEEYMTEKKQRAPRIEYTVTNVDALEAQYPELVTTHTVKTVDKSALYKKVRAAHELGAKIDGVAIGNYAGHRQPSNIPLAQVRSIVDGVAIVESRPHHDDGTRNIGASTSGFGSITTGGEPANPLADIPAFLQSSQNDESPL